MKIGQRTYTLLGSKVKISWALNDRFSRVRKRSSLLRLWGEVGRRAGGLYTRCLPPTFQWSLDLEGKSVVIYTERTDKFIAPFPSHRDQLVLSPKVKGKEGWRRLPELLKGTSGLVFLDGAEWVGRTPDP